MKRTPAYRWLWLVCSLCCFSFSFAAGQVRGNETVAGVALNLSLRGPWVAPRWRRPVPRFLLGQAISLTYEAFVDCHAWSESGHKPWKDIGGRLAGYLATELVVVVLHKVRG